MTPAAAVQPAITGTFEAGASLSPEVSESGTLLVYGRSFSGISSVKAVRFSVEKA